MKTNRIYILTVIGCLTFVLVACGGKKKSDDIITERVEQPKPQEPVRLQSYTDDRDVKWIGRTYHVAINRQPPDSLPMVASSLLIMSSHW